MVKVKKESYCRNYCKKCAIANTCGNCANSGKKTEYSAERGEKVIVGYYCRAGYDTDAPRCDGFRCVKEGKPIKDRWANGRVVCFDDEDDARSKKKKRR